MGAERSNRGMAAATTATAKPAAAKPTTAAVTTVAAAIYIYIYLYIYNIYCVLGLLSSFNFTVQP